MMTVALLLGVVMVIAAIVLLRSTLRGVAIAGRVIRRRTLRVSSLREGPVEVSGTIVPVGEAILSLSGHRCVAVETIVDGQDRTGSDVAGKGEKKLQRVVPARLIDSTGRCRLDLDLAGLVGERWKSALVPASDLAAVPWAAQLVPDGATHVTIEERIIPDGAEVLVTGDASLGDTDAGEGGYRSPRAEEWTLSGTAEQLLIVSLGGQARLVATTIVYAVVALAAAAYLGALGALMIALVVAG
jgi:hypothetical protein